MKCPLALLCLIFLASPASAAERRCGWLLSGTPGNWELRDKSGSWTLATQGQDQLGSGIPDINPREWVQETPQFGYGCACLDLEITSGQVTNILSSSHTVPLSQCFGDKALPRLGE